MSGYFLWLFLLWGWITDEGPLAQGGCRGSPSETESSGGHFSTAGNVFLSVYVPTLGFFLFVCFFFSLTFFFSFLGGLPAAALLLKS